MKNYSCRKLLESPLLLLAFFVAAAPLSLAQTTTDPNQSTDSTLTYPAAYFAEFEPVSVNDMLNQIPGIGLALDANAGGSSLNNAANRGLGASCRY